MAENDITKQRHETVERILPTVWRLCVMRLAGAESSSIDDAVQEVFLRWLESGRHFDSTEHEKAWKIFRSLRLM